MGGKVFVGIFFGGRRGEGLLVVEVRDVNNVLR